MPTCSHIFKELNKKLDLQALSIALLGDTRPGHETDIADAYYNMPRQKISNKCSHCGQYGKHQSVCNYCGAPID